MNLFVARQPIFDAENVIYGYELLYRGTAHAEHAPPGDPDRMSSDVIIQSFLEIGMKALTGGKPGFVNFGREMLLARTYEALDPGTVVVELVEDVRCDAEVVQVCEQLVASGYTLALDDYAPGGSQDGLLPLAAIVKVDVMAWNEEELAALARELRGRDVRLLAERVETADARKALRGLGFTLFQGYYFSPPETVTNEGNSIDTLRILPLLDAVQDPDVTNVDVEGRIRRDPSLSYKLLRVVNSAALGGRGVESIMHAINLVGRQALFRWLSLLLTSSLASGGGTSREMVAATLLRARLLELIGKDGGANGAALFLTGMFSTMDSLLRISISDLVERVRFAPEVRSTLLREEDAPYLGWLRLAEAYEQGRWQEVARLAGDLGLDPASIPGRYLEALHWTDDALADMDGAGAKPAGARAS
jgi:c-di-GMP phosphodiesterase